MKTVWTKGLKDTQRDDIRSAFLSNTLLRERALLIMQEKLEQSRKQRNTSEGYESPNWAYKQADACGYERAYLELISIFST